MADGASSTRHHVSGRLGQETANNPFDIPKAQLNLYRLLATQVSNEGLVLGQKVGLVSLTPRDSSRPETSDAP